VIIVEHILLRVDNVSDTHKLIAVLVIYALFFTLIAIFKQDIAQPVKRDIPIGPGVEEALIRNGFEKCMACPTMYTQDPYPACALCREGVAGKEQLKIVREGRPKRV